MKKYPKIGIRPTIDGRQGGVRESLEEKTMNLAKAVAELITSNLKNGDGSPVECVISDSTIGRVAESAACAEKFEREGVGSTITVTSCWCYGAETMDMNPYYPKAVWGFNGTERPGAVYLAAVLAGHAQKGLPAFGIYGRDVQDLDADFFVFSAHKVYGPTGVGVLYGKEGWLDRIPPYQGGGEMIQHVSFEKTTFNELPFKFEAGTPDYIGTTGLAKALDYVSLVGMDKIAAYEHELTQYAMQRLKEIPGMRIFGEAEDKGSVISFLVGDIHHFDMGTLLDRLGIAVRTGHHCAQPLMQRLGIEGTVRASFGLYNTREEIDVLVAGIVRVSRMF